MKHIASKLRGLSVEGRETPSFYRAQAAEVLRRYNTADPNFRFFVLEIARGCAEALDPDTRRRAAEILRPRAAPLFIRNKIKIAKKDHRLGGRPEQQ